MILRRWKGNPNLGFLKHPQGLSILGLATTSALSWFTVSENFSQLFSFHPDSPCPWALGRFNSKQSQDLTRPEVKALWRGWRQKVTSKLSIKHNPGSYLTIFLPACLLYLSSRIHCCSFFANTELPGSQSHFTSRGLNMFSPKLVTLALLWSWGWIQMEMPLVARWRHLGYPMVIPPLLLPFIPEWTMNAAGFVSRPSVSVDIFFVLTASPSSLSSPQACWE